MVKPLYAEVRQQTKPSQSFHHGLWWERFFDGYPDDNFAKPEQGKARFIDSLAGPCGDKPQLEANTERQRKLIWELGGAIKVFQTDWHFATGMGIEHPTENGFAWHRTLGTPYLPGSSVKGLVRGWIEWNGKEHERYGCLQDWFGGEPNKASEQAGWYLFFDALPTGPVTLAADVMTPHMGDWYENGDEIEAVNGEPDPSRVPADWHSPNPVTFLVAKEGSFQFGIAVRENLPDAQKKQAQTELDRVMAELKEALQWAGAGAKTAAGYGRMSPDSKANKQLENDRKAREAQTQSPETRLTNKINGWSELELAQRFGTGCAKTEEKFGKDFPLLFELAKTLRVTEISAWEAINKKGVNKGDKDRYTAYRKFNPKDAGSD